MPKKRRGKWEARVPYLDPVTGKRKELRRVGRSFRDAQALESELRTKATKLENGRIAPGKKPTVKQLIEIFEKDVLDKPAKYDPKTGSKTTLGRYAPGHLPTIRIWLRSLGERLGDLVAERVTPANLKSYREARLADPVTYKITKGPLKEELAREWYSVTKTGKRRKMSMARVEKLSPEERAAYPLKTRPRTPASVNRELAFLRRVYSHAIEIGLLDENPFGRARNLFSGEAHRERVLTLEQEELLLKEASRPERSHLRLVLLLYLDTALRKTEGLELEWRDVDLKERVITVRAETSKARVSRQVPITTRLWTELKVARPRNGKGKVIASGDPKRAFATACRAAGLDGLRLHDLRHTAATRMASRVPLAELRNITGHKSYQTLLKYVNPTKDALDRAGKALDEYIESGQKQ